MFDTKKRLKEAEAKNKRLQEHLDWKTRELRLLTEEFNSMEQEERIKALGQNTWNEFNNLKGEVGALRSVLTHSHISRGDAPLIYS